MRIEFSGSINLKNIDFADDVLLGTPVGGIIQKIQYART